MESLSSLCLPQHHPHHLPTSPHMYSLCPMAPPQLVDPRQESPPAESPLPHSPKCTKLSESCHSILRLSLAANLPMRTAPASIIFRSPIPESMGMRTVREWHWEQLLQYRLQWEKRRQQRIKQGLTLTTLTTSRICDLAHEDVVPLNTATDIPPRHRRHHPYLSDLDPYSPDAWSMLTSTVRKWQDWSMDCPLSSKKTTKILLRFRRPTLPKGWVYEEDIKVEESTRLPTLGPSTSLVPTTNVQHARRRQHPWDLNTTGGLPSSCSTSQTVRDERSLRSTSRST